MKAERAGHSQLLQLTEPEHQGAEPDYLCPRYSSPKKNWHIATTKHYFLGDRPHLQEVQKQRDEEGTVGNISV